MVAESKERLAIQAERLLDGIQTLGRQFEHLDDSDEAEVAVALTQCATALSRFVTRDGPARMARRGR